MCELIFCKHPGFEFDTNVGNMTCSEEAEAQFAEIELLLSMFPSEEELQVDELSHAELRAYVEGSAHTPPSSRPQFNIKLKVENLAVSVGNKFFVISF